MIKARNDKDLTEAEEIKKRGQEYTEELYKRGLNDGWPQWCGHSPRVLECEVMWALGSCITKKASGSGRIAAEIFQILKD